MEFSYQNSFVHTSPTTRELAGETLENACHKAVAYDGNGDMVLAITGEEAVGLLLSTTPETVEKGEAVDVLLKDVGLLVSAEVISKGDFITIENGCGKVASTGDVIFGRAITACEEVGDVVQVRVIAAGAVQA